MNPSFPEGDNADKALKNVMSLFSTLPKLRSLDQYVPKDNDVFIVTRGKSGTTLMQNLVYQIVLESGGGPEWDPKGTKFTDIGEVVPFLDLAEVTGVSSNDSTPRVFKSGISPDEIENSSARFIYIMRNGMNIPSSFLDFLIPWVNPGLHLTQKDREKIFHTYVSNMFLTKSRNSANPFTTSWFEHVHKWTSLKRENVLILNYEGICRNKKGAVYAVAKFLGLDISEEGKQRVVAACDRDTMAQDPRFKEQLFTKGMGMDPSGGIKVRKQGNEAFHAISFSDDEKKLYSEMFKDTFGVDTYDELVAKVAFPL